MNRQIILLLSVLFIYSCAFKGEDKKAKTPVDTSEEVEEVVAEVEETRPEPTGGIEIVYDDIDHDGIDDNLDDEVYVSNIPEISITKIFKLEMGVEVLKATQGHVVEKVVISNIAGEFAPQRNIFARKEILNKQYQLVIKDEINSNTVGNLISNMNNIYNISNFYPAALWKKVKYIESHPKIKESSGHVRLEFGIGITGVGNVNSISNIELEVLTIHKETGVTTSFGSRRLKNGLHYETIVIPHELDAVKPPAQYSILLQNLDASELNSVLNDDHKFVVRVIDYTFERFGQQYRYSTFLQNIQENQAKITISTSSNNREIYVVPNKSLYEFLQEHNDVEIDTDDNIVRLNEYVGGLEVPVNFNNDANTDGIWSVFGKKNDQMMPGVNYVLSYANTLDLLKPTTVKTRVFSGEVGGMVTITDLRVGDEYIFEVTPKALYQKSITDKVSNIPVGGTFTYYECDEWRCHPIRKKHTIQCPVKEKVKIDRTVPYNVRTDGSFKEFAKRFGLIIASRPNTLIGIPFGKDIEYFRNKIYFKIKINEKLSNDRTMVIKPYYGSRILSIGWAGSLATRANECVSYDKGTHKWEIGNIQDAYRAARGYFTQTVKTSWQDKKEVKIYRRGVRR